MAVGWDLGNSRGTIWGTNIPRSGATTRPEYDPNNPASYASTTPAYNQPGSWWSNRATGGGGSGGANGSDLDIQWDNRNAIGLPAIPQFETTPFNRNLPNWRELEASRDAARGRREISDAIAQGQPLADKLQSFANIDPNSIFEQYYKGLKAMGSIGIESNKRYQEQKLALEDKLRNSQSGLLGNLNGIEEARLFNILNQDKALYATNTAEIQRMKEYLLHALKIENDKRAEQRGYLGDQKGFVSEALRQALEQSQLDKRRGQEVLAENLFNIGSDFAGRGSGISRGRFMQDKFQNEEYQSLYRNLVLRDKGARLDRDKAMREIQSRLDQLDLSQRQDDLRAREDLAGYDSDKARLDAEQNKIGYNFMAQVASLRAKEKQRQEEQNLMRFYSALEQQRIQREAAEAQQRANQQAFFGAIQQQQAAEQAVYQQWASVGEGNMMKLLKHYYATGDGANFNKVKFIGHQFGYW